MPASARQNVIACEGKPAQCLTRRKRSSSAAAISLPSRMSAADESPWKAVETENDHAKIQEERPLASRDFLI